MTPRDPFSLILAGARGRKRKRFYMLMTLLLVAYLARTAPEKLFDHSFEVIEILSLITLIDVAGSGDEKRGEDSRRLRRKTDPPLLETKE